MKSMIEVTTTHLHQLAPAELVPSARPLPAHARFELAREISAEFSKFLYQGVGSTLHWADRLALGREQWDSLMRTPGSETHVLYLDGAPAGYVELAAAQTGHGTEVEIMYFGLFPHFIGRGLGGAMLTEGISRAWDLDSRWDGFAPVTRVRVNTCSLDGPAALSNYLARGLAIFHTETHMLEPGDGAAGMWPAG